MRTYRNITSVNKKLDIAAGSAIQTSTTKVILKINKPEASSSLASGSEKKRINKLIEKKLDLTKPLNDKLLSPRMNEESTRRGSGIPDDEQRSYLSTINQSVKS
jgi:hypothetical protein